MMFRKRPEPRAFQLDLRPHHGIGPILLGTTPGKVLEAMRSVGMTNAHLDDQRFARACDNGIEVEFDDEGRAQFIGIYDHPHILLSYKELNLFASDAQEVFEVFTSDDDGAIDFDPQEVLFPSLIVALWDASKENKHVKRRFATWGQIGVGNAHYKAAQDITGDDIAQVLQKYGISPQ